MTTLLDDGIETDAVDPSQFLREFCNEWIKAVEAGASLEQLCVWQDCSSDLWGYLAGYQGPVVTHLDDNVILANGIGGLGIEGMIQ